MNMNHHESCITVIGQYLHFPVPQQTCGNKCTTLLGKCRTSLGIVFHNITASLQRRWDVHMVHSYWAAVLFHFRPLKVNCVAGTSLQRRHHVHTCIWMDHGFVTVFRPLKVNCVAGTLRGRLQHVSVCLHGSRLLL